MPAIRRAATNRSRIYNILENKNYRTKRDQSKNITDSVKKSDIDSIKRTDRFKELSLALKNQIGLQDTLIDRQILEILAEDVETISNQLQVIKSLNNDLTRHKLTKHISKKR